MKKLFCYSLIFIFLFSSCGNEKKPNEITITTEDASKTTIVASPLENAAEVMQQKKEALEKLTPYTLDEMKALLPEELNGAKRSKFAVNNVLGASLAEATYDINDDAKVQLQVFDCAGQAGSGIYGMQYLALINFQSENDDESVRTIDFAGTKAVERIDKKDNDAALTWLASDRFLVTLESDNLDIATLKTIAGQLKLK